MIKEYIQTRLNLKQIILCLYNMSFFIGTMLKTLSYIRASDNLILQSICDPLQYNSRI